MQPYFTNDPSKYAEVDGVVIDTRTGKPAVKGATTGVIGYIFSESSPSGTVGEIVEMSQFSQDNWEAEFGAASVGYKKLANKRFGLLRLVQCDPTKPAAGGYVLLQSSSLKLKDKLLTGPKTNMTKAEVVIPGGDDVALDISVDEQLAELLTLANELKVDYEAHRVLIGGGEHGAADATNVVTAGNATDLATAITLLNDLRTQYEAHRILIAGSVHGAVDSVNVLTAAVADDHKSALLLAKDLKDQYEAHRVFITGSVHGAADTTNAVAAAVAYVVITISAEKVAGAVATTVAEAVDAFNADADVNADYLATLASGDGTADLVAEGETAFSGGADAGTYTEAEQYQNALKLFEAENIANAIFCDKYTADIRAAMKAHFALTGDKAVLLQYDDATLRTVDDETVRADVSIYRGDGIKYCHNAVKTRVGSEDIWDCVSWVASMISQVGPHRSLAAADMTTYTTSATGINKQYGREDFKLWMNSGISCFEWDDDFGAPKLVSSVSTTINDSQKQLFFGFRMRRYLSYSQASYLKNFQNKDNTAKLRTQIRDGWVAFLSQQQVDEILPKDADIGMKAFLVHLLDNTSATIGQNKFILVSRINLMPKMRFIIAKNEIGQDIDVEA